MTTWIVYFLVIFFDLLHKGFEDTWLRTTAFQQRNVYSQQVQSPQDAAQAHHPQVRINIALGCIHPPLVVTGLSYHLSNYM